MPTAYTSLLGLALPVTGELSGTWGDTVNDYITKYLDSSVAGTQTISGSQTAVTLTRANGGALSPVGSGSTGSSQYQIINCTGNPAGTLTITVDVSTGTYALSNSTYSQTFAVINATSTSQSVVVRATTTTGTSTGVTLVAGEKAVIAWNGSDFIKVATSAVDGVSTISFGTTGLTPSTATSGAVTVAGTLVAANGGTGQSSYTTGDLLYATGSTALSKLGIGTNGQVLTSTGTAPQWSTLSGVAVTTFSAGTTGFTPSTATSGAVTLAGTLATTNGGTGLTSFTANGVVYASSTSALTTGSALTFDGTTFAVNSAASIGASTAKTKFYSDSTYNGIFNGASLGSNESIYMGGGMQFFFASGSEQMRLTSTGLGIGTSSPGRRLAVSNAGAQGIEFGPGVGPSSGNEILNFNRSTSLYVPCSTYASTHAFYSGTAGGTLGLYQDASGNVGIGTSSPAAKLDVNGQVRAYYTGGFQVDNAGTMLGKLYYSGGLVLDRASATNFILAQNGSTQATLDSSGNLGLGVTPSAWSTSVQTALQVYTAGVSGNGGGNTASRFTHGCYLDGSTWKYQYTGVGPARYEITGPNAGSTHSWSIAAGGTAGNAISFTQAMTLDASGNLGVGTTSPAAKLHVNGPVIIANAGPTNELTFTGTDYTNIYSETTGGMQIGINSTGNSASVEFLTNNAERFRIGPAGQIGLSGANYGTSGQVLTSNGSGSAPTWQNAGGGGGSAATPTALGTVYGKTDVGTPFNTFGGYQTGTAVTSGYALTGFGWNSLLNATSANSCAAFGDQSLKALTTGTENTAIGSRAMILTTTGSLNTAVGRQALENNTTASSNTAVGYQAAFSNTTGNIDAFGAGALYSNTTGQYNTALGTNALYSNNGSYNVGVGRGAGSNNTGSSNIAIGYASLNGAGAGSYNVAVGTQALASNTTASNNTAVGYPALTSNTTGYDNTALGYASLRNNTTGYNNTAVGSDSLNQTTTGQNNTAVGFAALRSNTTASSNTAVGYYALYGNTTGYYNVSVGRESSRYMTTGNQNTAVGDFALHSNTTATNNTAVGFQALYSSTTSSGHVAIGAGALQSLATGAVNSVAIGQNALTNFNPSSNATNTAVGGSALSACTTGAGNVALGRLALTALTTGQVNVAIGSDDGVGNWAGTLKSLTTGSSNVAIGPNALTNLTTGGKNIGIGERALQNATTPSHNIAIGCVGGSIGNGPLQNCTTGATNIAIGGEALASLTTANGNTAVGYGSMIFATTAPNNTAVGGYTLAQTTTGEANTAVGYQAGNGNTTGYWNTLNGYQAGYYITTGIQNTLIGAYNGNYVVQLTTGSYNIHLGTYCYSSSSSVNNEIVIGYNNAGKGANTGFITSTSGVYQGNNSSSWSTVSDFRLKKNIIDNNEGLETIAAIRVRNFEYRTAEEVTELPEHTAVKKVGVQLGVIAQELQQVCPDCVEEQSTGVLSVNTDEIFWHMVNAIKQLKTELDTVKAELATLKGN